jgi:hypothetical protein
MVDVRGQLCRLAGLPMGWLLSPFHFSRLAETFVRHLRTTDPERSAPWQIDATLTQAQMFAARMINFVCACVCVRGGDPPR